MCACVTELLSGIPPLTILRDYFTLHTVQRQKGQDPHATRDPTSQEVVCEWVKFKGAPPPMMNG